MMFAGRAAGTKANILFDTGASVNFVSASFARQTGITVNPAASGVRLANDEVVEDILGVANVYIQLGAFHKPVRCFVMNQMYEVDVILGEEFMGKYNCILHYKQKTVYIQKGKRHITVKSPPIPRTAASSEENEAEPSLLSYVQVKRMAKWGAQVFLASLKMIDSDVAVASAAVSIPGDSVPPVQPDGRQSNLSQVRKSGFLT